MSKPQMEEMNAGMKAWIFMEILRKDGISLGIDGIAPPWEARPQRCRPARRNSGAAGYGYPVDAFTLDEAHLAAH